MKIWYCHSCDELFNDRRMIGELSFCCPICGAPNSFVELTSQTAEGMSDRMIELMWMYFGFCEYDDETETITEPFMDFPAGTDKETIWRWFDHVYIDGVFGLMYGR